MKVIVTGGLGYIGSHVTLALMQEGHDVVIVDNLSNSKVTAINDLHSLGIQPMLKVVDVGNLCSPYWGNLFDGVDAVIHMAGRKAVGESVTDPLLYYQQNVANSVELLLAMQEAGVKNIVFSSSAAVYAAPAVCHLPLIENTLKRSSSPYGTTKSMVEHILEDCKGFINSLSLRYFNPIGAHESGALAESGDGPPNNLFPRILDVARGKQEKLSVFGKDYMTNDGTCVRDYIHVMDIAEAHVAALEFLMERGTTCPAMNLGTSKGTSVLELIQDFYTATGIEIPYEFAPPRQGDPAYLVADSSFAKSQLDWSPCRTIIDACRDGWRSAQRNSA